MSMGVFTQAGWRQIGGVKFNMTPNGERQQNIVQSIPGVTSKFLTPHNLCEISKILRDSSFSAISLCTHHKPTLTPGTRACVLRPTYCVQSTSEYTSTTEYSTRDLLASLCVYCCGTTHAHQESVVRVCACVRKGGSKQTRVTASRQRGSFSKEAFVF